MKARLLFTVLFAMGYVFSQVYAETSRTVRLEISGNDAVQTKYPPLALPLKSAYRMTKIRTITRLGQAFLSSICLSNI